VDQLIDKDRFLIGHLQCLIHSDRSMLLMAVTSDEFRAALSRFPSGVTVVTTKDANDQLHGITVSAFCSVSLEPPLILVCVEKTTASHNALRESGIFVVNILGEGQRDLSEHFATQLEDKFQVVKHQPGIHSLPVLEGVAASLECRLHVAYDGGDHTIFVGLIEKITVNDVRPLAYLHGDYRSIPH
jgi:flavin reductase (DIM6/NTAB) family NADH-FMN oxidoreductase RutF